MLVMEIGALTYSKAEFKRLVRSRIPARTEGAIEYKWQNISAVLDELGMQWIDGLKPMHNYQDRLKELVALWLLEHPIQSHLIAMK